MSNVQTIYLSAQIGLLIFAGRHAILFFESEDETGLILISYLLIDRTRSLMGVFKKICRNAHFLLSQPFLRGCAIDPKKLAFEGGKAGIAQKRQFIDRYRGGYMAFRGLSELHVFVILSCHRQGLKFRRVGIKQV